MKTLKKDIRIGENLENQKKQCTFAMFKKTKSINRSIWNNKNKKIMNIEETKNERYVEIYATNNEGTTMTIRKFIGEKGMYEAYLDTYSKLINMGKK